ncbi:MAG: isochorismate synthase [Actinobacteria bacterium]|nr:isochorismate synthase [Actinomycetota bacterium]
MGEPRTTGQWGSLSADELPDPPHLTAGQPFAPQSSGDYGPFGVFPGAPSVAWVRHGEGLVGWGVAAKETFSGEERFSRAQRWLQEMIAERGWQQESPIAFASFTFDDESPGSVVVIPQLLLALRGGRAWLTTMEEGARADQLLAGADATTTAQRVTWDEDVAESAQWARSVAEAVKRIETAEIDKVVLAREVEAHFGRPVDTKPVLAALAQRYPECWTFHVEGLLGATPELLVRRFEDEVSSRVLAGTVRSAQTVTDNERSARALRGSVKDLSEHEYAVRSVAHALAAHCTDLEVADRPSVLSLANVQHLATDIRGRVVDGASALALAATLHPTAAVCGTPTERAMAVIADLETINRGRYSGPVGWFDASGNGEFGIALRCAQLADDARSARLFAGCGLVVDSDPAAELAESNAKLDAMRTVLSAQSGA